MTIDLLNEYDLDCECRRVMSLAPRRQFARYFRDAVQVEDNVQLLLARPVEVTNRWLHWRSWDPPGIEDNWCGRSQSSQSGLDEAPSALHGFSSHQPRCISQDPTFQHFLPIHEMKTTRWTGSGAEPNTKFAPRPPYMPKISIYKTAWRRANLTLQKSHHVFSLRSHL